MPRYIYKAIDVAGKPKSGAVMASNGTEAMAQLRAEGLKIVSCEVQRKAAGPPPIHDSYKTRKMHIVARAQARRRQVDPRFPQPELPMEFKLRRALAPSRTRNGLVLAMIMTGLVWSFLAADRTPAARASAQAKAAPKVAPSVTYVEHDITVRGQLSEVGFASTLRFNFHFPDVPFDETRSAREVELKPTGQFVARFFMSTSTPPRVLWLEVTRDGTVVKKWENVVLIGEPLSATLP